MLMFLTDEEKRMLDGDYGPGIRRSMQLLVKLGEAFDAERMILADSAHIHCAVSYDMLEELTEGAGQCRVITTTHPNAFPNVLDPEGCKRIGLPDNYDIYEFIHGGPWSKIEDIFKKLGFLLTYSCVPFYVGNLPKMGDVISWGGTSGAVTCTSMFGACGSRESVPANVATSVTGRVPYMGMAIKENRYARALVKIDNLDFENFTNADYGSLGYYIGGKTGSKNVVIDGMPGKLSLEQFRYLASPMPVSGATNICHVVGVTPEAGTLDEALGGGKPEMVITAGKDQIQEAVAKLTTADSDKVDMVKFGCPHCSIIELKNIASLLAGKKVHSSVRLFIATAYQTYVLAEAMGYVDVIKQAGGVFTNTCLGSQDPFNLLGPGLGVKTVATNSARSAHYSARTSGGKVKLLYGSMKQCIDAAVTGRWKAN
jgi:predicted aconitase